MRIITSIDSPEIARRLSLGKEWKGKARGMMTEAAEITVGTVVSKIDDVGIKVKSGNLINSIKSTVVSDTSAKVWVDEKQAPYSSFLNYGHKGFSLKEGLLNGPKSKISKEGFRYNRVPMGDGVVTISEKPRLTQSGTVSKRQAKWRVPAYSGRLFWEQGIEEARYNILIHVEKTFTELFYGAFT